MKNKCIAKPKMCIMNEKFFHINYYKESKKNWSNLNGHNEKPNRMGMIDFWYALVFVAC